MIKFIVNLLKVIFKRKPKSYPQDNVVAFQRKNDDNIEWIDENVGVEKRKNGLVIHSYKSLSPEEIMNIIKENLE